MALLLVAPRLRTPGGRRGGRVIDVVMIVVLALAIPNVIVYTSTGALPNIYFPPGVIADQQNYLLGSANQLLGGGALLVNVPVSQYGVGLIYFLDGWFHLVHIGYGTAGLLDGTPDRAFVHPRRTSSCGSLAPGRCWRWPRWRSPCWCSSTGGSTTSARCPRPDRCASGCRC